MHNLIDGITLLDIDIETIRCKHTTKRSMTYIGIKNTHRIAYNNSIAQSHCSHTTWLRHTLGKALGTTQAYAQRTDLTGIILAHTPQLVNTQLKDCNGGCRVLKAGLIIVDIAQERLLVMLQTQYCSTATLEHHCKHNSSSRGDKRHNK